MYSIFWKDSNGINAGLMAESAPQTVTLNGSAGAATLSAAIAKNVIRISATQPAFYMFTVAGAVTATTGHYLPANVWKDVPVTDAGTKISVLGATATAGVVYLSELG
jgi:hypothetical protein